MDMNTTIKDAIAGSIRGFRLPRYREIPDVGLYLEQATKYINQTISPLGFGTFTGSMVRNYVKQPVFLPGESQGQGNLVGCTESNTTEAT